jgi:transposase-like protein
MSTEKENNSPSGEDDDKLELKIDGRTVLIGSTVLLACPYCGSEKEVNTKLYLRKMRQIGITPRGHCDKCDKWWNATVNPPVCRGGTNNRLILFG